MSGCTQPHEDKTGQKKWPVIAFVISLLFNFISVGFNIYQFNDGKRNSKEFAEFRRENKESQATLLSSNHELRSIVSELGDTLKRYDLEENDRRNVNENLLRAKELSSNISQNGCNSSYPKPKIAGRCFEEPCNWVASANQRNIKNGQYGAVFLTDGSFAYVQRCGEIIHAIEKDKRGNPPTLKELNEFRVPKALLGTYQFKQVAPNVWAYDQIIK